MNLINIYMQFNFYYVNKYIYFMLFLKACFCVLKGMSEHMHNTVCVPTLGKYLDLSAMPFVSY